MATGRKPGRPPKPVQVKKSEGNLGKRKLPEEHFEEMTVQDIPLPPEAYSEEAVAFWIRIWNAGKTWLKPDRDYIVVMLLCDAFNEYSYTRRMLSLGSIAGGVDRVVTSPKGYPVQHPFVSQRNESQRQMVTQLSSLGFSPTDFARLQINEMGAEEAKLLREVMGSGER